MAAVIRRSTASSRGNKAFVLDATRERIECRKIDFMARGELKEQLRMPLSGIGARRR